MLHYNDKVLLTIIEGGLDKYFGTQKMEIHEYLRKEIGFDNLEIIKEISSIDSKQIYEPKILKCRSKIYKTNPHIPKYDFTINSILLLLEPKK